MKLFTVRALLAAALFGAIVVIPFLPALKSSSAVFALEVRLATTSSGVAKIYYDIGNGYNETDSASHPLITGSTPHLYRFPLPVATYRSLRFDPMDTAGRAALEGPLQIVSPSGAIVKTIPWSELRALQQIASLREVERRLEVQTSDTANDPQLVVTFSPPLTVAPTLHENGAVALPRALGVFSALAALLFLVDRAPRVKSAFVHVIRRGRERPAGAVALVAAIAVIASAYPVVFLGKSYVSPNFGTTLLYEALPTLPGERSTETASANGSDVGPAVWQCLPYSFLQHRALRQGELPLWNRSTLTGTPLLAQGQSMFGDPLHCLVVLCGGTAWAWDFKYLAAKWLLATGLGFTVLASLGARTPRSRPDEATRGPAIGAALIVTLAAPFIGFYVYRINHPAIFSLGYAPWVLYGWVRLLHSDSRRSHAWSAAGLFLANVALLNSGTVKEACVLILTMNATGFVMLLAGPLTWKMRFGKLALAAWSGVLAVLVTTPVWATFLHTLPHAFTASMHATADQVQPSLLLAAFDELFFRPLSRDQWVFNPSLNFLLLLGVLYFGATLRLHFSNRPIIALTLSALTAMAFAFGVVPRTWIVALPFLANIGHVDNTFLCALVVLWSVLAGIGFATAGRRLRTADGRGDLAVSAALLLGVVAAWIGFHHAAHRAIFGADTMVSVMRSGQVIPISPFVWGSLAFLIGSSIVLALVAHQACQRRALGPGGALVAVLCTVILLWRHGMHTTGVANPAYVVQPPPRASFHGTSPAIAFAQAGHRTAPGRIFGLHGNVTPGWNALYNLEAIYGPDALQNRWLRQLIDASQMTWSSTWRLYLAAQDVAKARPFLDALNVRYYLDLPANPALQDSSLTLSKAADLNVYESATAWPRAFFTDRIDVYDQPAELVEKIRGATGRPFAAVQRNDSASVTALAKVTTNATAGVAVAATAYRLTENTTSFRVQAKGPGAIVLTEAYWPDDFRAEVNGLPAPVLRLNHAFKGVLVSAPGDYAVTFRYWPKNFTRHLLLCALGVGLLAASLFFALRPVRPRLA